jgi:membrane-associated protease RseP (regulator of RpoE activity)
LNYKKLLNNLNLLKMKKVLLLLVAAVGITASVSAQDLAGCKNVCEKKRIVESGPFIGIRFTSVCGTGNVVIMEVLPNTAAAKNGFAVNDVITSFEGNKMPTNESLVEMVAKHQPGDIVSITYMHEGLTNTKRIALGAQFTKEIIEKVCCDEPVSKFVTSAKIVVSPNPANDKITIESVSKMSGEVTINIIDLKGQLVKTATVYNEGLLKEPIDISGLAAGQYFVKVQSASNQFIEKLVIAK